ncbi:hypothetical protein ES708_25539 [subsurface metagenome]
MIYHNYACLYCNVIYVHDLSNFQKKNKILVLLLAVALVVQMGGFPQPITGPLVNTILYLAALLVGSWSGIIIGICTPVMAFMRGILPPPLSF